MERYTNPDCKPEMEELMKDCPRSRSGAECWLRLCDIEDILGDEYDLGRLKVIMDAERYGGLIVEYPPDDPGPKGPPGCCPNCGRYGGISWDAQTDVSTCALCGWTDAEAALRREQDG